MSEQNFVQEQLMDLLQKEVSEEKEQERIQRLADSLSPLLPKKRPGIASLGDSLAKVSEFEREYTKMDKGE